MTDDWLHRAAAHLDRRDGRAALTQLLAGWRECLDPLVAALIDRLSDAIAERVVLLPERTQRDTTVAWMQRARQRDSVDLGPLLLLLDVIAAWGHVHVAFPCFEHLCGWVDDPRVAAYACRTLELAPFSGSKAGKIWIRCGRMILASPDYRSVQRCERLIEGAAEESDPALAKFLSGRLAKIAAQLSGTAVTRPATAVDPAGLEAGAAAIADLADGDLELAAEPVSQPSTEAEFLQQIIAHPQDDAIRQV